MAIIKQYDKRSGITYAYESHSYWDNEKQMTRAKRKLIGRVDPETGEIIPTDKLKWNRKMHALIREMLHYRNSLSENETLDPVRVAEKESRYDEILKEAEKEYEYEPPSDYYREGYNLYRRLVEYKESELLFLHDKNVPADNSLAKRMARVYKRKQKQVIVFRSDYNVEYLCDCLGLIYTLRHEGGNLYEKISDIYGRKRYRKKRKPPKCTEADVSV